MAAPVIGLRPRYAPRAGAVIDQSHALAVGLEFCFVPNVNRNVELARGYVNAVLGSPSRGATAFGPSAALADATGDSYNFTCPDAPFLGPISVLSVFRNNTASAYREILSKCATNGNANSPFDIYLTNTASPQTINFLRASSGAGSANQYTTSTGIVTNTDNVLVITATSASITVAPTIYLNGVVVANTRSGTLTGNATGGGSPIRVGRRADGGTQADGSVSICAVWSRALSSAEAAQLYADPFCFLRY